MYSKISYGSEGKFFNTLSTLLLMYSKISYGSEGDKHSIFFKNTLQYSTNSYGSEGISFDMIDWLLVAVQHTFTRL